MHLNPRIDLVFKKIFGVEENKDLLISLINSIVSEADQVKDVTLLNPYNPQSFYDDKLSILDIKALGQNGKRFNIEMQLTDEADYDKRALYYWAKVYTEQLKRGEGYGKLAKVIGIHILNFTSILGSPQYHHVFHLKEKDAGFQYFKNMELHTLELEKFYSPRQEWEFSDLVARIKNSLDMWLAFLTRHDLLQRKDLPPPLDNPALQKAQDVLEVMNFKPAERQAYEEREQWFMLEENALEKKFKDGKEEGREEGREEGLKEGEKRGIEKGIEEGEKRGIEEGEKRGIEKTALSMLSEGLDAELISKVTGLSVSEIRNLS